MFLSQEGLKEEVWYRFERFTLAAYQRFDSEI